MAEPQAGTSARWAGRGLALVAVLLWGASYLWGKEALAWLQPFATAGARYAGAAIVLLLLVALRRGNPLTTLRGHWGPYLLLGFLGIACFQSFFFAGLRLTSPVSAAVIMALTPIFTAIGAAIFLRDRLTLLVAAGMAVSVVGAALRCSATIRAGWPASASMPASR